MTHGCVPVALLQGKELLPDELIVKVIVTAPLASDAGGVAGAANCRLAANPTDAMLKGYCSQYSKEGYVTKLADFNLLAYMQAKGVLGDKLLGGGVRGHQDAKCAQQRGALEASLFLTKELMC